MRRSSGAAMVRGFWSTVLLALLPAVALAQTGRIAGLVTDQQGTPVQGAQVSITNLRIGSVSDARGQFVIANVPVGTHDVHVRFIGFRETVVAGVEVRSGETANITARLEGTPVQLGGMVVSASRRPERITDAPATVTTIGVETIEKSVGPSWAGALKQVTGLDFIQVGATAVAVNARGFNSSFNNRMLMMEDGRIAVLPENGLPVGQFTAIPKIDLEGVEVLVGPGAALYGPDASNGVVTLRSKDPRTFPGTSVEVTGGSRSFGNVQARHAQMFGNVGVKVTGEWQEVHDWENELMHATAVGPRAEEGVYGDVDWRNRVVRGQGSLVYYMSDVNRLEVSGGASVTDGVGQTNVGRNQLDGWQYEFQQAKLNLGDWFFNAYRARSRAGNSYAINRYTENRHHPNNASLSNEQVKLLSDWPSDGRMYAGELQHTLRIPQLRETEVVWGGQYRRDVVSSERQWLTDRLTGEDLEIGQFGVYAQTTTPLSEQFSLVLASRYDDHENYDAQFSPKAGLIFRPTPDQALRVTYNRAFKSPTTLQTNFHIPDWTAVIAIFGNTEGFTRRDSDGNILRSFAPMTPEENTTLELGYKGVLAQRLFVDVAMYRSQYEGFMSPLTIIGNPFAPEPTFAYDGRGELIENEAGITPIVLTYFNLGEATLLGTDTRLDFLLTPSLTATSTFSWLKLDEMEVETGFDEATALNSPNTKWSLGMSYDARGPLYGGLTVRHVNSYYFRSGINRGIIPTYTGLDLNVGYRLPRGALLNVGVNNLFSCSGTHGYADATADPFRQGRIDAASGCGMGRRQVQMINMPAIGTMVFAGIRYDFQLLGQQ